MAEKPLSQNLPADLPTDWAYGQTVAPQGSQAGLAEQYGYNYLMQQVNNVQSATNTINNAFPNLAAKTDLPDASDLVYTLSASYSGTVHALTGFPAASGLVSCVFTAAANYTAGDTFTVDGTPYTIQLSNGETADDNLFVSGATVSVVLDTAGKKINFKAGGGLSNSALALATALVSDVAQGKTFYAGDKTLKTGTLIPYKYATGSCVTTSVSTPGNIYCSVSGIGFSPFLVVITGKETQGSRVGEDVAAVCINNPETNQSVFGARFVLDSYPGYIKLTPNSSGFDIVVVNYGYVYYMTDPVFYAFGT